MHCRLRRSQQCRNVQLLLLRPVIEMEVHARSKPRLLYARAEGCALRRAGAAMHAEIGTETGQPISHAEDWCHPDAARKQQVATRITGQMKVIARNADLDRIAGVQLLVHRQ